MTMAPNVPRCMCEEHRHRFLGICESNEVSGPHGTIGAVAQSTVTYDGEPIAGPFDQSCGAEAWILEQPIDPVCSSPLPFMTHKNAKSLSRVDFLALGAFMPTANPSGEPLLGGTRAINLATRGLLAFVEGDERERYYQITDAGRAAWTAKRDGTETPKSPKSSRKAKPAKRDR